MKWHKTTLEVRSRGKGMIAITDAVQQQIRTWQVQEGLCVLFLQHTSASLVINENYDPTAQMDMEQFMERIAPEGEPWMEHTLEGSDDSTSHLRSMLTPISLTIPIENGRLCLGTWQGLYLFEHRTRPHTRRILMRAMAVDEGEMI
ncbi:MAG: YjbQ family protein [Anaerolineae bacterium]|nr:YjbQ family protein [Anaerolineae bacterium]